MIRQLARYLVEAVTILAFFAALLMALALYATS
jgi:hypothetical protein